MSLGIKALMNTDLVKKAEDQYRRLVPHPIHRDECNHGRNNFVMTVHGCDIHRYWNTGRGPFTNETALYCVRYGSDDGEYLSSISSLEEAISLAQLKQQEKGELDGKMGSC